MKDVIKNLIKFLIFVLLCIAIIYVVKWSFETIYYSDMPIWLKYILLRM